MVSEAVSPTNSPEGLYIIHVAARSSCLQDSNCFMIILLAARSINYLKLFANRVGAFFWLEFRIHFFIFKLKQGEPLFAQKYSL